MQSEDSKWLAPYSFVIFPCPDSCAEDSLKGVLVHLVAKLGREIEKLCGRSMLDYLHASGPRILDVIETRRDDGQGLR